jgi:hypothetical protein
MYMQVGRLANYKTGEEGASLLSVGVMGYAGDIDGTIEATIRKEGQCPY